MTGTVRANYFFGKPVDHAEVSGQGFEHGCGGSSRRLGKAGTTDEDGAVSFRSEAAGLFCRPAAQPGCCACLIEATVKDAADHAETRGEPITVSESPLLLTAIPEGGTLVPGH